MKSVDIYNLGVTDYKKALDFQFNLLEKRINNEINDTLILLEHPPTITVGRSGKKNNLLISDKYLSENGIEYYEITRGGDITFHGPGQVVCYPIIDLKNHTRDIHKYLRDLEEIIINTLGNYGIHGRRLEGLTGVWVKRSKIASIGVGIRRWVTYHGLAININTDLSFYDLIIPCGITDVKMTSVKAWKNYSKDIDIDSVKNTIVDNFISMYGFNPTSSKENIGELC